MNHCVIATKTQEGYMASICHYEDLDVLERLIQDVFCLPETATALIMQGDTSISAHGEFSSYHQDWGYSWSQCCPISLDDRTTLNAHAESVGAQCIYIFENNEWIQHWTCNVSDMSESVA